MNIIHDFLVTREENKSSSLSSSSSNILAKGSVFTKVFDEVGMLLNISSSESVSSKPNKLFFLSSFSFKFSMGGGSKEMASSSLSEKRDVVATDSLLCVLPAEISTTPSSPFSETLLSTAELVSFFFHLSLYLALWASLSSK